MGRSAERHNDTEMELYEIAEERAHARVIYWPLFARLYAVHALVVFVLVFIVHIFVPERGQILWSLLVVIVYFGTTVQVELSQMQLRINRMEVHAVTTHACVLDVQKSIDSQSDSLSV